MIKKQPSPPSSLNKDEYIKSFEQARSLIQRDELSQATQILTTLLKQHPTDSGVMELLGVSSEKLQNYEAAIKFYRAARERKPERYCLDLSIANMLVKRGDIEDGIKLAEETLSKHGKSLSDNEKATAYNIAGNAYMMLGQEDKAAPHLEKACIHDPDSLENLYNNVTQTGKPKSEDDKFFKKLKDLEQQDDSARSDHENALLYYAFFDCYDAIGEYEKAFDYALLGASYKHKLVGRNKEQIKRLFGVTRSYFTQSFFENHNEKGHPSDVPVFIIGMPRSGTTLLEQILQAHPQVGGVGEDAVLSHLIKHYSLMQPHEGATYPFRVSTEVEGYFTPEAIGQKYTDYILQQFPQAKRIINKAIDNMIYLGYLHIALPNAKFIHIKRNAMDTCISAFTKSFAGDVQGYSYDLEELGLYYKGYNDLMEHWNSVLPGKILNINYEDIVENLEKTARQAIDFINLEWDERCLSFYKEDSVVRTASISQVRQPIYKGSVDRWKRYGTRISPLIKALSDAAPQEARSFLQAIEEKGE